MSDAPHPRERWSAGAAILGAASCAVALMVALAEPRALAGWLAAFMFWGSLPIGALCLVMMMRLIPGAWDEALGELSEAALLLLPLALLAAVPVLARLSALYDWVGMAGEEGFRSLYLAPWTFAARTLLFFGVAGGLTFLLIRRRRWAAGVAAAGLIVLVPLDTLAAADWLMSLDPAFHSSGFGLYLLSIQTTVALAGLILARPLRAGAGRHTGLLGGLLLTALLLWAYLAFMQYFITWSGNLAPGVVWYQRRAQGAWSLVEHAIGALALAPALLLLFPSVRCSRRWLTALALAVLAGKALEMIWLVLPSRSSDLATIAVLLLAFVGMGALTGVAFVKAMPLPARWRARGPASREVAP